MSDINDTEIYNLFNSKTVALVGNSSALDKHNFGTAIDNHDVVCRINKGPLLTSNKEKYGSRTDVLFYSEYKVIDNDVLDTLDLDTKLVCYYSSKLFDRPTYKITKHFYNYIQEISGYEDANIERLKKTKFQRQPQWPTNGLVSACFILDQCPAKLTLFGFDWNKNKTFYKQQQKKEKMHNWELEKEYLSNQDRVEIISIPEDPCPKL